MRRLSLRTVADAETPATAHNHTRKETIGSHYKSGGPELHRLSVETLFTVRVSRCAPVDYSSLSTPPPKVLRRLLQICSVVRMVVIKHLQSRGVAHFVVVNIIQHLNVCGNVRAFHHLVAEII